MAKKKGKSAEKKFAVFLLFVALALVVYSFLYPKSATAPKLTLVGTFAGTTPCADCPGIKTKLTLFSNPNTYTVYYDYIDKNTSYTENGTWVKKYYETDEGQEIYILSPNNSNTKSKYEILSADQIRQLDGDGNAIPNTLNFTLTKTN